MYYHKKLNNCNEPKIHKLKNMTFGFSTAELHLNQLDLNSDHSRLFNRTHANAIRMELATTENDDRVKPE